MNQPGNHSISRLIDALRVTDWTEQERTIDELVAIGEQACEQLIQALEDSDGYVRAGVANALGRIGSPKAAEPPMLVFLDGRPDESEDGEDTEAGLQAVEALVKLNHTPAAAEIVRVLPEVLREDVCLSWSLIDALDDFRYEPALDLFVDILTFPDHDVVKSAGRALANLGEIAVERLIAVAKDCTHPARHTAIRALARDRNSRARLPILDLLLDSSEPDLLRFDAARALGEIGDSTCAPHLIDLASSEHLPSLIRGGSCLALGRLRVPGSFELLLRLYSGSDRTVRFHVTTALGDLGDSRAVPYLTKALRRSLSGCTPQTIEAIGKIADCVAIPELVEFSLSIYDDSMQPLYNQFVEEALQRIGERCRLGQCSIHLQGAR